MRVGIVFGGANSEHAVSRASARGIAANLDPARFTPVLIGIDRQGLWHPGVEPDALDDAGRGTRVPDLGGIDVAFPALHGRFGEDGTVQGMLEVAAIPYVGCGVLASALAMDKAMAQVVLAQAGIATPATRVVTAANRDTASALTPPLFVKPNRAGSSVGASRVDTSSELEAAITAALAEDDRALVQTLQPGEEIDIAVLQRVDGSLITGPALRVRPAASSAFFDYAAKYTAGGVDFEVPARLASETSDALASLAMRAFDALGCDGLARVDFFVDGDSIVLNEVNTLPGLTALSQFPRIWAAAGLGYREVLTMLIDRALVVRR